LPSELEATLRRRAGELGRPEPVRADDVLSGAYADLLWTLLDRDATSDSEEVWRAHLRAAVGDFRRIVATLRAGGLVVIFPEGELSTDGQIGPLQPGLASLVRRGRTRLVQPVAISYDPLTYGRTRAYVSFAPAIEPTHGTLEHDVTEAMRRATPLTPGQMAASVLSNGGSARGLVRAAKQWIADADAEGRPVDPGLRGARTQLTLRTAFAIARSRGAAHTGIRSLAHELDSARRSL
jgi:1-acyl-sn-glycerol-3-phosphate acyltransferase